MAEPIRVLEFFHLISPEHQIAGPCVVLQHERQTWYVRDLETLDILIADLQVARARLREALKTHETQD